MQNLKTNLHRAPLPVMEIHRMPLQLEIVSEHREIVGDDAVREFRDDGGTIGRSFRSDWILPDPDRYISAKHAAIDVRSGVYYLVDLSSNGVFINEDRKPLGRGNSQRLFDGDHLRMGQFEIDVRISEGESIDVPSEGEQPTLPDPIEQSVEAATARSGVKLLDEDELADDDLGAMLFADDAGDHSAATGNDELADELDFSSASIPVLQESAVDPGRAFAAFLEGLGVTAKDLGPGVAPEEVLYHAGEVLREFTEGVSRLLASRAGLKTTFRLDQTTVMPQHNNPIKLSNDAIESLRELLIRQDGEYLPPRDAVREACRDLLFHQDAFLDAMTAAFDNFATRFDPDELIELYGEGSKALFGIGAAKKRWEMYCDIYPALTEKAGGRFPQLFAEEFVRNYEQQIAEFKRLQPGDGDLGTTRRLDHAEIGDEVPEAAPPTEPSAPAEPAHTGRQAPDLGGPEAR